MSPRAGGTSRKATKKPVVVVAGESANDREILRSFLEAFCPQMRGRVIFLNDKVPLRDASEANLGIRVRKFAAKVRARAERERASVAAVFLHEDLDDVDSARYDQVRDRVQRALTHELDNAHYVLAVWEIEAWLLLFPDEVSGFATGWQVPAKRRGKDTGKFRDPKRIFKEEISKARAGAAASYRESDGPLIAAQITAQGKQSSPTGSNRSYSALRRDAMNRCKELDGART